MSSSPKPIHVQWAEVIKIAIDSSQHQCCLNCDAYYNGKCNEAIPPAQPPAEIIMFGCPSWDNIPF